MRAPCALGDRARAGETELNDEEREASPPSAMPDLVAALDRVRHVALQDPSPDDEITWFLLQRLLDVVEREHPVSLDESEHTVRGASTRGGSPDLRRAAREPTEVEPLIQASLASPSSRHRARRRVRLDEDAS